MPTITPIPKPAQVIVYRIIGSVFLIPTVTLTLEGYYIAALMNSILCATLWVGSFAVAKEAREEKEAERQATLIQANLPPQSSLSQSSSPPASPQANPPGYSPPSYAPYTPAPPIPPLPPMPNMPGGSTWSSVPPPPGSPPNGVSPGIPNVPPPDAAPQTPVNLPRRSPTSSASQAWVGPAGILVGMALFVAVGVAVIGYTVRRNASLNAIPLSAQNWNGGARLPQQPPSAAPRVEKRVLALYYPWYRTPQRSQRWEHQSGVDSAHRRMTSHTHYPAQGPYDSADAAVLDRQLQQAKQAGIDTFVCSWWGQKDATDSALHVLMQRAAKTSIKVCVLWEQPAGQPNPQALDDDLAYLLETFGKQPAYLRVDEKPVVFVLDRVGRSANEDGWLEIRNDVARRFAPGALLIGDGYQQALATVWNGYFLLGAAAPLIDGQTPSTCARVQNVEYNNLLSVTKPQHRLSVVTVFPGYDDRKPNAAMHIAGRTFLDRHEGQLYEALWQQAIADDPDWILVNSFNQWHAGTEIEPSVEMGDKYLRLTRKYAAQFKNSAAR